MPYISEAYRAFLDDSQRAQLFAEHTSAGYHPDTKDKYLIPNKDRFAGMYMFGKPGRGKSGELQNLILQDIYQNQGVIILDPHGDLTVDCIAQLPPDKIAKTYLLDMEDEDYPFGVNVFAMPKNSSAVARSQAMSRVLHSFETIWPDTANQLYFPLSLRAAVDTLFAHPHSTLIDMYHLVSNEDFRRAYIKPVTDPETLAFWQDFDQLPRNERAQQLLPLRNRSASLIMGRPLVRNIVGQAESTLDFRKAIENKEIIFIRLPIKTLSQDARLIGTLLIAQLHAAVFSFSDMPENERPGFSLYIDEFQNFVTSDINEMFTEGRKFGLRLTVAHQYRDQLPKSLQQSTMTAQNVVCFQPTLEDSREVSPLFVSGQTSIEPEDLDHKPLDHLLYSSPENEAILTFIDDYLAPLQSQIFGGQIEIRKPGINARHVPYWVLSAPAPTEKPRIPDPQPMLNRLLYEVMRTGNKGLEIPPEIVYGFANCGLGFYPDFNNAFFNRGTLLSDKIRYSKYLVVEGRDGPRWTREPDTSKEQMYHFLFHLRVVMSYVADNPIGKKSSLTPTEISRMLTQLPKRAAFVRSGEDVGVIFTDNTLPHVDTNELRKRLYLIRGQTRQKYCVPKEALNDVAPPAKEPVVSRWEEVK